MPFDANLVLADTTLDWDKTNIDLYGEPVATSRNSGGFAVVDLLALSGTSAQGMAVILVVTGSVTTADELTLTVESSDQLDFVSDATNDVRTLATFDILGKALGIIEGSECPCTVVRRIVTTQRYIRAHAEVSASDDYGACWVLLAPWPFNTI